MASETLTFPTRALIDQIAAGEPAWLTERRLQALDETASLQLPTSKQTRFEDAAFAQAASAPIAPEVRVEAAPDGVVLMDLRDALRERPDLVEPHLLKVFERQNLLHAQHAALTQGGLLCYVPKGTELKDPLRATIHFAEDAYYAPHILVVADELTKVDLIVELLGEPSQATVAVTLAQQLGPPPPHPRRRTDRRDLGLGAAAARALRRRGGPCRQRRGDHRARRQARGGGRRRPVPDVGRRLPAAADRHPVLLRQHRTRRDAVRPDHSRRMSGRPFQRRPVTGCTASARPRVSTRAAAGTLSTCDTALDS